MDIDAKITISRRSDNLIVISIIDESSRIEFVEMKLNPHDLAMALTGMSHIEALETEVRGLQYIGKTKEIEKRSVICPLDTHDRPTLKNWIDQNCEEEGWKLNSYLGSQTSISYTENNERVLNYSVYRYV